MAYEFKNLNEVPVQDKPTESTTIMAFENGNPRQIPAGEFRGKALMVDLRGYTITSSGPFTIQDMNYDPIYEAIIAGQNVVIQLSNEGVDGFFTIMGAGLQPGTGFIVITIDNEILFTNGSYHTAT